MGGIKSIFGGGGGGGYKSGKVGQYEQDLYGGIKNRAGAPGIGGRISMPQATQGYDLSGMKEAEAGYRKPTQFNFQGLPEQYGNLAYNQGAKDVRREAQGQLQQQQEAIGTRRPGLLMKAAEGNQRNLMETLGNLNSNIRLEEMRKNTDLAVDQQKAQAQERMANLAGLQGATQARVGVESGLTETERNYQDKVLDYLMSLYGKAGELTNQTAAQNTARRGQTLNFLGGMAPKL